MKQRFCSGSVSIFYVLILVGLISVLFAFLEAARVSALKSNVHLLTGQAEDAVYASYQPELWEQYHLLFWEESGEGNTGTFPEVCNLQKDAVEQNWESQQFGHNFFFLQAHCSKVEVEQYQLDRWFGAAWRSAGTGSFSGVRADGSIRENCTDQGAARRNRKSGADTGFGRGSGDKGNRS